MSEKSVFIVWYLKCLALGYYYKGGRWFLKNWEDKDWYEFVDSCRRYEREYDVCFWEMLEVVRMGQEHTILPQGGVLYGHRD